VNGIFIRRGRSMHEILGVIPSPTNKKKEEEEEMWAQRQSTKDEGHGKMEAGNYIDAATGKE
jgi:hypothetical protein